MFAPGCVSTWCILKYGPGTAVAWQYICVNAPAARLLAFRDLKKCRLVCPVAALLPLGHLVPFWRHSGTKLLKTNKVETFTMYYISQPGQRMLCVFQQTTAEDSKFLHFDHYFLYLHQHCSFNIEKENSLFPVLLARRLSMFVFRTPFAWTAMLENKQTNKQKENSKNITMINEKTITAFCFQVSCF